MEFNLIAQTLWAVYPRRQLGALGKTLMAGLQIQLCCCRIFGSSDELSNEFILVL